VAENWAKYGFSVFYTINDCYGAPVDKYSKSDEKEVILIPTTEWKVTKVSFNKERNWECITIRPLHPQKSPPRKIHTPTESEPKKESCSKTDPQKSPPRKIHTPTESEPKKESCSKTDKTSSGSSYSANNANATDEEGFTTTQIALIVAIGITILAIFLGIVCCCLCRGKLPGGAQNPYDRHRTNHHPSEHPLSRFRRVQRHRSKRDYGPGFR